MASAQSSLSTIPGTVPAVIKQSSALRATPSSQVLHLAISLPSPNLAAFEAFVNDVSNPQSPNFHKFLTPAQVGAKFGASNANLLQVENYLRAEGFKIKLVAASHLQILADATVFQAESAFHTTIEDYHSNLPNDKGRINFYSNTAMPKAPAAIASKISNIFGLENHTQPIPQVKRSKKQAGPGYLTPPTTSVFYDSAVLHTLGYNGQGKTVAIANFSGFRLTQATDYIAQYNLPTPSAGPGTNITVKTIDGGSATGAEGLEGDLDFQMVLNQAPLSNIIIYDGGSEFDVIVDIANDNLADTSSESYGIGYDSSGSEAAHQVHLQMSAQGQTYMCATGDTGANQQGYPYPDLDPDVTTVGGTTITATTTGVRTSEVGWTGSGGGWMTQSTSFNFIPSWQVGPGVLTAPDFRFFPDVSLDADPDTGETMFYGGNLIVVGGTSQASPLFAADVAIIEQFLAVNSYFPVNTGTGARFGRMNDLIYSKKGNPLAFFDVIAGSNGTLPNGVASVTTPGWDTVTGWGSMDMNGFAQLLIASPPQNLAPISIGIYTSPTGATAGVAQGANLAGSSLATLVAADGIGYTEQSVPNEVGPIAANQMTYQLSTSTKNPVLSADLTYVGTAPNLVTTFFYLKNISTGLPDLVGSAAMTGSPVTFSLPIDMTKYKNSAGQITLITRNVFPGRLSNSPYQITIDEATVRETF